MHASQHPLSRFTPVAAAAGVMLALSFLTRIALSFHGGEAAGAVEWARVFGFGLLFDAVMALYLLAPAALWLAIAPNRLARTRVHRMFWVIALLAWVYGLVVLAVSEWLFWDEFGARFNFIAVDYLLYTHEVLGNVWQSYPVARILAVLVLPAAAVTVLLAGRLWRAAGAPLRAHHAFGVLALYALSVLIAVRFVDTDLHRSFERDAMSELAGNGAYEFFAANYRNELPYERHYATVPLREVMQELRALLEPAGAFWVTRDDGVERLAGGAGPEKRLNVILVSVESLGAEFLGAYGDSRGLTPNLDRLAAQSLWFSNVYATGNRTVRGMEALALALPPTPGQSIVRRPNNQKLFSLGSVFEDKGYAVLFAYGGYGYFDNLNAFFDANDYRVIDRRDIPNSRVEFENIWGVADEHLFDQVLEEIDREHARNSERPVFAHVMTTSNHRPYTYPAGRVPIASGTGREGAVQYSDYAIGRFLRAARTRPWFDDTVFVITADHGANARGTTRIPVEKYRIPLFVYSPRHVAPGHFGRLMSQIDIAPTLLGLLEFRYYTKFLGRDVLRAPPESDRAFVANYQTLGLIKGDRMAVLHPKRRFEALRIGPEMRDAVPIDAPQLVREAIVFYQAASHLFRDGKYLDEEQVHPEQRSASRRPARPSG